MVANNSNVAKLKASIVDLTTRIFFVPTIRFEHQNKEAKLLPSRVKTLPNMFGISPVQ